MSRGLLLLTASLQASAFLLPPNVAQVSDNEHATGLNVFGPLSPTNAVVQLPCSECAFSGSKSTEKVEEIEDEPLFWIQGGANSILVNMTVSEDGQRLEVNGETIYPLGMLNVDMFSSPKIYVDQVRSGASLAEIEAGSEKKTPLQVTGHSISVRPQDDDLLTPIEYQIFEVEGQLVSLDAITVRVLDLLDGLALVTVETEGPKAIPRPKDFLAPSPEDFLLPMPRPESKEPEMGKPEFGMQKECNMLPAALCKLRNIVEAKLMGIGKKGGCHGRKGGRPHGGKLPTHIRPDFHFDGDEHDMPHPPHGHHFHPEMDEEEPPRHPHHHGRPHHMRPHHHHGHHRHHFMHAFTRGLAAVLIPTMAGIAVGMTVSLIGLIFGRLIGFLWIKFYRGGRRGYASVALNEASADAMDVEKEAVDEESLPVYEQAPAYEEVVKEAK